MSQSPTQNTAVELDASDLPVFCPNPKMTLWSQHPRVYLDVTHEGQARCPYCSTLYRLKPGVKLPTDTERAPSPDTPRRLSFLLSCP